jgi:hypothetical protein
VRSVNARHLLLVLAVVASAAAAVALNVLLLGNAAAGNDPVGKLSPKANLPAAPTWTIHPTTGKVENHRADD